MSENIWRSELIISYRRSGVSLTTDGIGEWTTRNGENAIKMTPTRFYGSSTYQHILENEFISNTRYLFNFWLDTDDQYHNSTYGISGIRIWYSDGTRDDTLLSTSSSSPRGWQLKRYITKADKSVSYLTIYYGYNDPNYFRWDSYVMPIDETNITKAGQLHTHIAESYDKTSIVKGGGTDTNQIYEY